MAGASLCRLLLVALFLAQLAHVDSASLSHKRHHKRHHHSAAAVPTEETKAVLDDATVLSSSAVETQGKQEVDEDADDDDDADDEDEDDSEATKVNITIPTAVRASKPDAALRSTPDSGDMLESNYGVDKNEAIYVTYTPQGRLAKARQRLQDNLMRQAQIATELADMQNATGFQQRVDTESTALAAETQASSLAKMLSGMRKEMRQFAAPFYLENLNAEKEKLTSQEVGLKSDLDAAAGAMGLGHQGWPEPGHKVVVAESTFRRPVAFLGSA